MVDLNPTISITTFIVSGLNPPIKKNGNYQSGLKKKTQLHMVYKRLTLNIKTQITI